MLSTKKTIHRKVRIKYPDQHSPILILTVLLEPEYKFFSKCFKSIGASLLDASSQDKQLHIERWQIDKPQGNSLEIALAFINGMGNAKSSLETFIYLDKIEPHYVFLCGIAGSLKPDKAALGDVVIAKKTKWHGYNKIWRTEKKRKFELREFSEEMNSHTATIGKKISKFISNNAYVDLPSNAEKFYIDKVEKWTQEKNKINKPNKIHFKDIISWDYVLNDSVIRDKKAKLHSDNFAVEMEGAGFYHAIQRRNEEYEDAIGPVGFVFRGISDLCHRKEDDVWREIASVNVAAALVNFLKTFEDDDFKRDWPNA